MNITEDILFINGSGANISDIGNTSVLSTGYSDQDADKTLERARDVLFTIQYVLLPVFLVTGLFGNIFTIVTMMSSQFSHLTSRSILIFLALSDSVLLLTQPFNKIWIVQLFGRDLRSFSDFSCKFFFVIFRTSKMTSSWLVVLLCFERFVAVVYPLHAKTILRKRYILPAIAIDYMALLTYNSFWSFSSGIVDGICKPDLPSERQKIFVILGSTLYSFLPTGLLLVFTPQIMVRLFYHQNIRQSISAASSVASTTSGSNNKSNVHLKRASVMVLSVMLAYIVLIIPITTVHVYAFFNGVSAFDVNTLGFFIYREIAQTLEQVNYAVNFLLYVLCSRVFRQRVKDLLCWPRLRKNKNTTDAYSGASTAISNGGNIITAITSGCSSSNVKD